MNKLKQIFNLKLFYLLGVGYYGVMSDERKSWLRLWGNPCPEVITTHPIIGDIYRSNKSNFNIFDVILGIMYFMFCGIALYIWSPFYSIYLLIEFIADGTTFKIDSK